MNNSNVRCYLVLFQSMSAASSVPRWTNATTLRTLFENLRPLMPGFGDDDIHTISVVCSFIRYLRTGPARDQKEDELCALKGPLIDMESNRVIVSCELPPLNRKGESQYVHLDDIRRVLNLNEVLRSEPIICVVMQATQGHTYIRAHVLMAKHCYQLGGANQERPASELVMRRSVRIVGSAGGPLRNRPARKQHNNPYDKMPTEMAASAVGEADYMGGMPTMFAFTMLRTGLLRGQAEVHLNIRTLYPKINKGDITALSVAATGLANAVAGHTGWTCEVCGFCAGSEDVDHANYMTDLMSKHNLTLNIEEHNHRYEVRIGGPDVRVTWEYAAALIEVTKPYGGLDWMRVGSDMSGGGGDSAKHTAAGLFGDDTYDATPISFTRTSAGFVTQCIAFEDKNATVQASSIVRIDDARAYISVGIPKAQYGAAVNAFPYTCTAAFGIEPHLLSPCTQCESCVRGVAVSRQPRCQIAHGTGQLVILGGLQNHPRVTNLSDAAKPFYASSLYGCAHLV